MTLPKILRTIALLALLWTLLPASAQADDPRCFTRNFHWSLDGRHYHMQFDMPWDSYDFYARVPRIYGEYGVYSYEHPAHTVVSELVTNLTSIARARRLNEWETVRLTLAFVQHLRYQTEPGEYPKFPIETLADRGGDCEDLSILLTAMFREMGYATLLINPPGHMALALACKNCDGLYFELFGRKFFYVETTARNYEIGIAPDRYKQTQVKIFTTDLRDRAMGYIQAISPNDILQRPHYYVQEDDHLIRIPLDPDTYFATTKVRSMLLLGNETSIGSLTGIGDNDSAILPPLAWAASKTRSL